MSDIKDLIPSYIKSLNVVLSCEKRAEARGSEGEEDRAKLRNMETDLRYVLNWLTNETEPGPKRGIEHRSKEQRLVYMAEIGLEAAAREAAKYASRPALLENLSPTLQCKVRKVMLHLSSRERQAFMLRHVSGYQHHEIAEIMTVSESTVRVMLHRARKKFSFLAPNNCKVVNK